MSPRAYIAHMSSISPSVSLSSGSALTPGTALAPLRFAVAESELEILACYRLMQQLRPGLADAQTFLAQVKRMQAQAYVLMAAWLETTAADENTAQGLQPLALAGYRLSETLLYGHYLYVDDLVTCPAWRGQGLGHALLQHIFALAHAQGLGRVVLDTGLDNLAAQRFYQRAGMQAQALRFGLSLKHEI